MTRIRSSRGLALLSVFVLYLLPASAQAYDNPTGDYLMSFHACDPTTVDCSNPGNHVTYLAESTPSSSTPFESFQVPTNFPNWSGSVPDVVKKGDNYYFYNAGNLHRYNRNTLALSGPTTVTINGLPPGHVPTDAMAIVEPLTNDLKLFFMDTVLGSGDPAMCPSTCTTSCDKVFKSATEVSGSNGEEFDLDPGRRLTITIRCDVADPVGIGASDPDVFVVSPTSYVLLVSRGGKTQAFTGSSLSGPFSAISTLTDSVLITSGTGPNYVTVPTGYYDSATGKYHIYAHTNAIPPTIQHAELTSLSTAIDETSFSDVLTSMDYFGDSDHWVASPGFTSN